MKYFQICFFNGHWKCHENYKIKTFLVKFEFWLKLRDNSVTKREGGSVLNLTLQKIYFYSIFSTFTNRESLLSSYRFKI